MSKAEIEYLCRIICKAMEIDPDRTSFGSGNLIPKGQKYHLWEAQSRVAEAILQAGYTRQDLSAATRPTANINPAIGE